MKLIATLFLTILAPFFATLDLKPADSESKIGFVIKNFGINVEGEIGRASCRERVSNCV